MGQIPRSIERISSYYYYYYLLAKTVTVGWNLSEYIFSHENLTQTMTTGGHTRASYETTTCSCWRRWTSRCQDLSVNFTRTTSSVQWKETTSAPSRRRSEPTRSYCQCSVASLLKSFNCFSMHSTTVDSDMSATSSPADHVCKHLA